jgi:hypothetical protein
MRAIAQDAQAQDGHVLVAVVHARHQQREVVCFATRVDKARHLHMAARWPMCNRATSCASSLASQDLSSLAVAAGDSTSVYGLCRTACPAIDIAAAADIDAPSCHPKHHLYYVSRPASGRREQAQPRLANQITKRPAMFAPADAVVSLGRRLVSGSPYPLSLHPGLVPARPAQLPEPACHSHGSCIGWSAGKDDLGKVATNVRGRESTVSTCRAAWIATTRLVRHGLVRAC